MLENSDLFKIQTRNVNCVRMIQNYLIELSDKDRKAGILSYISF
jgi:hypothetical protein